MRTAVDMTMAMDDEEDMDDDAALAMMEQEEALREQVCVLKS